MENFVIYKSVYNQHSSNNILLTYPQMKNRKYEKEATSNLKDEFNYIYSYTLCTAKEAALFYFRLNSLISIGKHSCDPWHLDNPIGNGGWKFPLHVTTMHTNIFIFFVKDKFIGVVQLFLIPNFIFISI